MPSLLSAISKNPWAPDVYIFEIEKVFNVKSEKWQLGLAITGKSDELLRQAMQKLKLNSEIQKIDQKILDVYKIRKNVNIVIIDIDVIENTNTSIDYKISKNKQKPISKFSPTIRDLSFIVSADIVSNDIENAIVGASDAVLFSEVFDEFKSDKFGEGNKNIAFHVWLQNMKGPVDEKEATEIIDNIIKLVENKFKAKLRS
jgi:phenylalanyl-tRNA synthetase beta chain